MGVDHSAFACLGAKVDLNEGVSIDHLDRWINRKSGLSYREWGSRCYGGAGGFIVCDAIAAVTVDFDDAGCDRLPDCPVTPDVVQKRIDKAISDGAPFTRTSQVAWWVGGHTW